MTQFEEAHAAMRGMNEQQRLAWMDGWAVGIRQTREQYESALAAATGTAKTATQAECEASQSGPTGQRP